MPSPVARQAILLSGTAIKPVWQTNFLNLVASQSLPAGLTYTKSGSIPATLFDSTGKLTYQGNNLVTRSNTPANGVWSLGNSASLVNTNAVSDPFGGTQATTLHAGGAGSYWAQLGAITSPASVNSVSAIYVRRRTGTGIVKLLKADASAYVDITSSVSSTWALVGIASVTHSSGLSSFALRLETSGDEVDFYNAALSQVTYETTPRPQDQVLTTSSIYLAPRLDTNPSTLAPAGLLVEEQRVQLLQKNIQQASPWFTVGSTVTTNAATSPDGTSNANSINDGSATASRHIVYQVVSGGTTAATTYTYSGFFKAGTLNYIWVQFGSGSDTTYSAAQVFNLTGNGSLGETRLGGNGGAIVGTPTITSVGNGWFYVTMAASMVTKTDGTIVMGPATAATGNNWNGTSNQIIYNGTNSVTTYYVYSGLELGSFATSVIPNPTSSTVTRTADVVTPTTYAAKASIWQRKSESAGTTARTYYAPGALPSPFDTGYWYQSMAAYSRALTIAEQTPRLIVGAPY